MCWRDATSDEISSKRPSITKYKNKLKLIASVLRELYYFSSFRRCLLCGEPRCHHSHFSLAYPWRHWFSDVQSSIRSLLYGRPESSTSWRHWFAVFFPVQSTTRSVTEKSSIHNQRKYGTLCRFRRRSESALGYALMIYLRYRSYNSRYISFASRWAPPSHLLPSM